MNVIEVSRVELHQGCVVERGEVTWSSELLKVLEILVEEILCRSGVYTGSVAHDTFSRGKLQVSAREILCAIPLEFLRARHVRLLCDVYSPCTTQWQAMMRRVVKKIKVSRDEEMYDEWKYQWIRCKSNSVILPHFDRVW